MPERSVIDRYSYSLLAWTMYGNWLPRDPRGFISSVGFTAEYLRGGTTA